MRIETEYSCLDSKRSFVLVVALGLMLGTTPTLAWRGECANLKEQTSGKQLYAKWLFTTPDDLDRSQLPQESVNVAVLKIKIIGHPIIAMPRVGNPWPVAVQMQIIQSSNAPIYKPGLKVDIHFYGISGLRDCSVRFENPMIDGRDYHIMVFQEKTFTSRYGRAEAPIDAMWFRTDENVSQSEMERRSPK